MSYQVLARKWRPRAFAQVVGQEHVVQVLVNGLKHDRMHHACLFTGARGVGKTTIARIVAMNETQVHGIKWPFNSIYDSSSQNTLTKTLKFLVKERSDNVFEH